MLGLILARLPPMGTAVLGALGLKALAVVMTLASTFLIARYCDPATFGFYGYFVNLANLAAIVCLWGLPQLTIRRLSAVSKQAAANAFRAIRVAATGPCAVVLAGTLCVLWLAREQIAIMRALDASQLVPLVLGAMAVTVVLDAQGRLRQAALRARGAVLRALMPEFCLRPLAILFLTSAAIAALTGAVSLHILLAIHVIAMVASFAYGQVLLGRSLPAPAAMPLSPLQDLKAATPFSLFIAAQNVNMRADILLLGIWINPSELAVYVLAKRLVDAVSQVFTVSETVFAPTIARQFQQGQHEALRTGLSKKSRVIFGITVLVSLPLLLWPAGFLNLFGAGYGEGATILVVLLAAQFVNAFYGGTGQAALHTGNEHIAVRATTLAASVNVLLQIALVPLLGAVASAWALLVSHFLWKFILNRHLLKTLQINTSAI
jgi:O-antigen/teichoic acid export membrane protein